MRNSLILTLCMVPALAAAQSDPVAKSAAPPAVESQALDAPNPGAAGLLPAATTGFPTNLWLGSEPDTLTQLIQAVDLPVPALRSVMRVLMLAEAEPPAAGEAGVGFLSVRLDWLRDQGAVDEALALLDIAGVDHPHLFQRWTDLSLLKGRIDPVCKALAAQPHLSDDLSLRVFCTARHGDWQRAVLVLQGAETLGEIPTRRAELLARFLDHDLHESGATLLPPVRPSPLEFRLFEALGEPLPTAQLPLSYSVLDLNGDNGWRAQIEAAERLARAGTLPANRLLGLYSLRRPAASGGVWDRVKALQTLESKLARQQADATAQAVAELWPQMTSAGLLVPFAELFAKTLADQRLEQTRAERMVQRLGYLSPDYELLAANAAQTGTEMQFLRAIATGAVPSSLPDLPHAAAIQAGFGADTAPAILRAQLDQGRLGEVILRAMVLFASGAEGNGQDLTDALTTFRAVGLEDLARRSALQLTLLDAERARR